MSQSHSSHDAGVRKALYAGILANFGVAVAKFLAFLMTRSAAMLAESVHSLADSSNQALLLLGLNRSARPASQSHPFGYAVERYFWTFVVSINIFMLGAVVAIHEGIEKMRHPHPIEDPTWNYIALGLAAIFETYALRVAWVEFKHWRQDQPGSLWNNLRKAKDLSLPAVLFEDAAALVGLLIAAAGIGTSVWTHSGFYDGLASVLIGVVLLGVAWFLASESHSLLIGEAASERDRRAIRDALEQDVAIQRLVEMHTLQRGPDSIMVSLVLEFVDDLSTDQLEVAVRRVEADVRAVVPAARHIFVEAGALRAPGPRD